MDRRAPVQMIGIFGGTFDPVHAGHLRTALEVMEVAHLDEVRFIPCARPPHRTAPVVGSRQRVEMLEKAIDGVDGFSVDRREIERPGPSYTLDTLISLREELGSARLCLIIGMDAFESLHLWHRWQEILGLAHLIVAHRPGGSDSPKRNPQQELMAQRQVEESRHLAEKSAGAVFLVSVTQLAVSATALRELTHRGRSLRYLTPEPVCSYIRRHGLYRSSESP